jgi:tape measure domain-containing protein
MATVQELLFRISASSDQLSRELAKGSQSVNAFASNVNNQLDKVEKDLSGIGKGFGKTAQVLSSFRGTLATLGVSVGLKETAQALVDAALKYDRLQTQLQFGTGSSQAASAAYADLQKMADRLGLSFDSTARSFASFAAATRGTAIQGAETTKIFEAVAEAAATLKLSASDTEGVFLALSQMVSKGTVQAEELRGQLGERLPGAFNLAAKALGVTTQQLGKMLQQGQIVTSDFLPKFADELHNTFGTTAVAASDSAGAAINRLQNAWDRLLVSLSNPGAIETAANQWASVIDKATEITNWVGKTFNASDQDTLNVVKRMADQANTKEVQDQVKGLEIELEDLKKQFDTFGKTGFYPEDQYRADVARIQGLLETAKTKLNALQTVSDVSALPADVNQRRHGASGSAPARDASDTQSPQSSELTSRLRGLNLELDAFSQTDREQAIARALSGFENAGKAADEIKRLAGAIYDAKTAQDAFSQAVADQQREDQDLLNRAAAVIKSVQLPIDAYRESLRNLTELRAQDEIGQDDYNRAVLMAARTAFPEAIAAVDAAAGSTREMRDTVEQLNEALNAGVIKQEEWNKAVDKMADTSSASKSAAQELKDASNDATQAISTGLEDAILNGKSLNDVLDGLLKTLAQIALRVGATKPLEGLLGGLLGHLFPASSSGLSDAIGGMIATNPEIFADGGIMTSRGKLPLKRYAGGGIARSAQLAMYGEGSRPEAIVPLPDGRAIPVNLRGGGGAPVQINTTINVDGGGGGSAADNQALAKEIQKQVVPSIRKMVDERLVTQSRSGGMLNRGGPR